MAAQAKSRVRLNQAMMDDHIPMVGFPQIIVTRGWMYQWLKGLGWDESKHGYGELDYTVFEPKATSEPLTPVADRDYYMTPLREDYRREANPHRSLREVLFGKHFAPPEDFELGRTWIDPKYGSASGRVTRAAHGAVKDVRYKGQLIRFDGNYWRTAADPESGFESPREAKQFIDAQRNPSTSERVPNPSLRSQLGRSAAEFVSPSTYAGMAGEALGGVLDRAKKILNPRTYSKGAWVVWYDGARKLTGIVQSQSGGQVRIKLDGGGQIVTAPESEVFPSTNAHAPRGKVRNGSGTLPVWLTEVQKTPPDGRRWTVWSVEPIPGPDGWIYVHGEWPKRAEAESAVMEKVKLALADRKGKFGVEFHTSNGRGR